MKLSKSFQILAFLTIALSFTLAHATTINILNKCSFTAWAGAVPGGGQQLDPGQIWTISVNSGTTQGRIWPRTGCSFNASGHGHCQTGDCNGLLQCQGYGVPPNTLVEYAFNQLSNLDYFDISLVDGFNVPLAFTPAVTNATDKCRQIECSADINGQCPAELKAPGGCNNPCTVFKTDKYCCISGSGSCEPTIYSEYFKVMCPVAYSNPKDEAITTPTITFTCPTGTNYNVVFCP